MTTLYKGILIIIFSTGIINHSMSQDSLRWSLAEGESIVWEVEENDSHVDHIEMSGFYISSIVHYGVIKWQN